ncbi:MAG: hypothetical protein H7A33_08480 [Deltaproteobacteria bacterium]|nr:hypothetical protein [Deltaproteobacteria bacterium]
MRKDVPHKESLQKLAEAYLLYLKERDAKVLRPFLSLQFMTRQKAKGQLDLISHLPQLLVGYGMEVHLFSEYNINNKNDLLELSPFQFEVSYSSHMSHVDLEKITITLNELVLEDQAWKIKTIISDDERSVLESIVQKLRNKQIKESDLLG